MLGHLLYSCALQQVLRQSALEFTQMVTAGPERPSLKFSLPGRRCSASLIIREMQIKTTGRCHLSPIRMEKCRHGCGDTGSLAQCQRDCKIAHTQKDRYCKIPQALGGVKFRETESRRVTRKEGREVRSQCSIKY